MPALLSGGGCMSTLASRDEVTLAPLKWVLPQPCDVDIYGKAPRSRPAGAFPLNLNLFSFFFFFFCLVLFEGCNHSKFCKGPSAAFSPPKSLAESMLSSQSSVSGFL